MKAPENGVLEKIVAEVKRLLSEVHDFRNHDFRNHEINRPVYIMVIEFSIRILFMNCSDLYNDIQFNFSQTIQYLKICFFKDLFVSCYHYHQSSVIQKAKTVWGFR